MTTYYTNTDQFIQNMRTLFERVAKEDPEATRSVSNSRLIIRLQVHSPEAKILINGRHNPVVISYEAGSLKPDIDISLPADTLHRILLKDLSLKQALASGQMRVRGPILKTFALEDIFHKGQEIYPQVLRESSDEGSEQTG